MLDKIPEWLGTAILGAVFAVVGFLGKWLWDWREKMSKERAETVGRLQGLQSLLKASKAIFDIQQELLRALIEHLRTAHPKLFRPEGGYEENIALCHAVMGDKEKELHGIIRTYTENSMKSVNEEMLEWLKADKIFKCGIAPVVRKRELAEQLFALEIHLLLWQAKYKFWIPGHPEHALVYMEDENRHGMGFPSGGMIEKDNQPIEIRSVDTEVKDAVEELRSKWK